MLSLDYSLPSISPSQSGRFVLNLDLLEYFSYYINSASVTIVPPEGATFVTPELSKIGSSTDMKRDAFQQTLTISRQGVSYIDSIIPSEDVVPIAYEFNSLWIAFRPTSWMWVAVIVAVVVISLLIRPRAKVAAPRIAVAKAAPGVTLTPEHIKQFSEVYEEKAKITQELRALEARAQHGRIPRRRYKVQRRTLELRLETLSQSLAQLKAILRSSGGSYADAVRQIEAEEVELNEVQLATQNLEVRHEAGEISLETYRKQLADLEKRKEKANASVNGLLLRLRGEIR